MENMLLNPLRLTLMFGLVLAVVLGCSRSEKDSAPITATDPPSVLKDTARIAKLASLFEKSSIVDGPKTVACTLSGGTATTCFSITVTATPSEHPTGPWCPRNISDGKDKGGIWLDKGTVHDVDGAFIKNIGTFYGDASWQLYDPATGSIKVTDSKEACAAAARPDVDAKYQNHCVECLPSYLDAGASITYVIPLHPVDMPSVGRLNPQSGIGVAFNGVKFDAPAPVDAILGAHTLAPFDDCGGHVNLHAGYHYHAARGCSKAVSIRSEHAPTIGVAMDGYSLYSRLNPDGQEPNDLDACRGHVDADIGYHYHVDEPGKNQIIGCFKAEQGCSLEDSSATCDASKQRRRPPPRR
jgi:hypothetical protein